MNKKLKIKPTEAELEILQILWDNGPGTVREIHEILSVEKHTGYTTTLKIMQKMAEKGLVKRNESQRSHIYEAAIQAEQTQKQLLGDLLKRAFSGDPAKLVLQALSEHETSPEELSEIRQLLDDIESGKRKRGK